MSEAYLGQITMFAGNFAPKGTAFCNGQILSINQNQALFALLGTQYGGNGTTTFALPDLRSRLTVHQGQGPGLSPYVIGQLGGTETVTLTQSTIPAHTHLFNATTANASATAISAATLPAKPTGSSGAFYAVSQGAPNPALVPQTLAAFSCGLTGGSQPHSNLMPSLCITFVISLVGVFPSRN